MSVPERLAIMACPYCGAPEPHAEDTPQGYQGSDAVIVWCMSCGEQCQVIRNTEDEDGEEEGGVL